jgi:hypothetical protein
MLVKSFASSALSYLGSFFKMQAQRVTAAEKEAAAKRATEAQILEDAGRLIATLLSVPASVDFEKTLVVSLGSPR